MKVLYILVSDFATDLAITKEALIKHMEAVRIENLSMEDYHLESHKHWNIKSIENCDDAELYFIEAMQGDNYSELYKIFINKNQVKSITRNTETDEIIRKTRELNTPLDQIIGVFKNEHSKDYYRTMESVNFSFMNTKEIMLIGR